VSRQGEHNSQKALAEKYRKENNPQQGSHSPLVDLVNYLEGVLEKLRNDQINLRVELEKLKDGQENMRSFFPNFLGCGKVKEIRNILK